LDAFVEFFPNFKLFFAWTTDNFKRTA
jgi:hypothetical protein